MLTHFDAQVQTSARLQAGLTDDDGESAVSTQQAAPLRHAGSAFKSYHDNIALFASIGAFANAAPIYIACAQKGSARYSISLTPTLTLVRKGSLMIQRLTVYRVSPLLYLSLKATYVSLTLCCKNLTDPLLIGSISCSCTTSPSATSPG